VGDRHRAAGSPTWCWRSKWVLSCWAVDEAIPLGPAVRSTGYWMLPEWAELERLRKEDSSLMTELHNRHIW
jgi:hypothetical protein